MVSSRRTTTELVTSLQRLRMVCGGPVGAGSAALVLPPPPVCLGEDSSKPHRAGCQLQVVLQNRGSAPLQTRPGLMSLLLDQHKLGPLHETSLTMVPCTPADARPHIHRCCQSHQMRSNKDRFQKLPLLKRVPSRRRHTRSCSLVHTGPRRKDQVLWMQVTLLNLFCSFTAFHSIKK